MDLFKNIFKNVYMIENYLGGAANGFCLVVNADVLLNWYFS